MNWLFIHQNFPGQYVHAARHLAAAGEQVVFITQQRERELKGVRKIVYAPTKPAAGMHPFVHEFSSSVENGLTVARICEELKRGGFTLDLIAGHNGWGELLYVKDSFPSAPLLGYFEFYYRPYDSDLDFDQEFPASQSDRMRIRTRNAVNLLGLQSADWGQTPTEFQRSLYPEKYRREISVIHEGIDTETVCPDPSTRLWLAGGLSLSRNDLLITYSARNLEPYRGFHIVMRTLPELLTRHPTARVLIVGGNDVSYGRRPPEAKSWREHMLAELDGKLDLSRVHFLGRLNYPQYLAMLRISAAHIYFTFLLSFPGRCSRPWRPAAPSSHRGPHRSKRSSATAKTAISSISSIARHLPTASATCWSTARSRSPSALRRAGRLSSALISPANVCLPISLCYAG